MQTRVFAEVFCRTVRFDPAAELRLLDLGCALGDALVVFHRYYPRMVLTGMDLSTVAVSRAQTALSSIATFRKGGVFEVEEGYDVIYASNLFEHFADYQTPARFLIGKTRRLGIMVPYDERFEESVLQPNAKQHHQRTFHEGSFDFLLEEGLARSVRTHRVRCPRAWGFSWKRRWGELYFFNPLRWAAGRPLRHDRLQIIYDLLA